MYGPLTNERTRQQDDAVIAAPSILLVEDSQTAAAMMEHALREARLCNPIEVVSTVAAAAARLAHGPRPALVLLDYELPDGNGLDLLRNHLDHERLASVPVIMLSTHEGAQEIDEAYRLGVSAYLVKPVAFGAVENLVRRLPVPWFLGADDGTAS